MKKYIYIILCCLLPLISGAYGDFQPDGTYSVQALYFFDGDTDDYSGNSNDGTLYGSQTLVYGRFGQAYDNGDDEGITITDHTTISGLSAVTVEIWIYVDDWAYNDRACMIIGKSNYDDNREYRMRVEMEVDLIWQISPNGNDPGTKECRIATSGISEDTWHYAVGTYDSATDMLYLYIDGELEDSESYNTAGIYDGSANASVGSYGDVPYGYDSNEFVGIVDSARISDRAMTAVEIKQVYAMQRGAYAIVD